MKTKFDDLVRERVFEARRQGKTLREISSVTGVSVTTVKTWLADAAEQKIAGIRIRKYFSSAERKMILAEYADTDSAGAICSKYRINKATLLRWKAGEAVVATSRCGTTYTVLLLNCIKCGENLNLCGWKIGLSGFAVVPSPPLFGKKSKRSKGCRGNSPFTHYAVC